jgi:DNA-binding transcriptional regulator YiaG
VNVKQKPKPKKRAVRRQKSRSQGALLVRGIRRRLKLTQKAFAAKLGVAQMTISRWESGECPVRASMRLALRAVVAAEPKPAKRPVAKARKA